MKTDFEKQLDKTAQKINQMIQSHDYALQDIFSKSFMLEYTNSTSIENFLTNSPIVIDFSEDFRNISNNKLDDYVSNNTPFATWNAMYTKSIKIFLAKKLGL